MDRILAAWDVENMSVPARLLDLGRAYMRSSIVLFEQIDSGSLEQSANFHNACAAAALAEHAVELFLKGAIRQLRAQVTTTHELVQLYGEYKNLYPGRAFAFKGNVKDLVTKNPKTPNAEFFRYPISRSTGALLHTGIHFTPSIWLRELRLIAEDFERLTPGLLAKKARKGGGRA